MACSVCTHPAAEAINLALSSRSSPTTVLASTHGLTYTQLNWHKSRHLSPRPRSHPSPPSPAAIVHTETSARARGRFLEAFGRSGNITHAAKQAGVARKLVYQWQEQDDAFAAAFRDAAVRATEVLEREAWRRAKQGIAEPVYQHGKLVGTVTRYSDALLMFLLKARAPEKYRDRVDVQVGPVIKAVAGFDPADVL